MTQTKPRNPLFILFGFMFLGMALTLLIFGSSLLGKQSNTPTQGLTDTQAIFEQANELAETQSGSQIFSLDTGFLAIGDQAPNFVLSDLNGNTVQLNDLQGKPVILNFWATWCPPCRVEMPELETAYQKYADQGLVILALDQAETAETVRNYFYEEMGLTFTPLLDENGSVSALYSVYNFPTSFFVNAEGQITMIHRGPMSLDQIDEYMSQTLNQS